MSRPASDEGELGFSQRIPVVFVFFVFVFVLYVCVFLVVVACVHCRRLMRESWVSLSGFYLSSSQMQSGKNKDDDDQS